MTNRTSRLSQCPASKPAAHFTTGPRNRPLIKLLTIDEAAELFNASPRTVRRFIEAGALPVHRLGRLVRISEADIAAFLAAKRSV